MADVIVEKKSLKGAANAIRSKTGKNGLITPEDFAGEIESIGGVSIEGTYYKATLFNDSFEDELNLSVPGLQGTASIGYGFGLSMNSEGDPYGTGVSGLVVRSYVPTNFLCGETGKDVSAIWKVNDGAIYWSGLYRNLFHFPANYEFEYEINGVTYQASLGNTKGAYGVATVKDFSRTTGERSRTGVTSALFGEETSTKWRPLSALLGSNTPVVYQNVVFCKLPMTGYNTIYTPGSMSFWLSECEYSG